ncbi:MAG: amidophosphoribosyltransferase, partial [Candidatus Coatesbacteria bacterium 4484_99]
SSKIINMLRRMGADEVHLRVSSPPITHSCFYGIDTPTRKELAASSSSVEEIESFIGADSLRYLSLDGLMKAVGTKRGKHCIACFTGDYPVPIPEEAGKEALEKVISRIRLF